MGTSTYFSKFDHTNEQTLLENIIVESIRVYGHDVYYLPRTKENLDSIFGEDSLSSFDNAYPVEMYIKNVDGFEGEGTFLGRFGLEIRQQITFTMARCVWDGLDLTAVPKEGDLVYFPLTKKLFEIQFVEHESVFYQTGALQTYDLQCELFEYSDEDIDTGVADIDAIENENAYVQTFPITFTDQGFVLAEDNTFIINEDTPDGTIDGQGNQLIQDTVPLFTANELITGQQTLASGNITTANASHINVTNISKTFTIGEEVVGGTSGARGTLGTKVQTEREISNDPAAENVKIETVADGIIDFSEDNPFSEDY